MLVKDVRGHEPHALKHARAEDRLEDGILDGVVGAWIELDVLDHPLGAKYAYEVEDVEDEEAHAGEYGLLAADEEVRKRENRGGHAHHDENDGVGEDDDAQSDLPLALKPPLSASTVVGSAAGHVPQQHT